jgi:hypothetical protein
LNVIQLKINTNIKNIRTVIKIMENTVKIPHVVSKTSVVCRSRDSTLFKRLTVWKLFRPGLSCIKTWGCYSVLILYAIYRLGYKS